VTISFLRDMTPCCHPRRSYLSTHGCQNHQTSQEICRLINDVFKVMNLISIQPVCCTKSKGQPGTQMSTSTVISLPFYKLGTLAVHTGHKPLRVLLHTHTHTHTHMTFFERQSLTKCRGTYKITSLQFEQSSCFALVIESSGAVIGYLLGIRRVVDSILGPISGYSE
jgi:hypothetical protein